MTGPLSPLEVAEEKARHRKGQPYIKASQLGELSYCELQGWLTSQGFERSQQAQARMAVGDVKHQQLSQAADDILDLQQKAQSGLGQARNQLGAKADALAQLVQKGDLMGAQALAQQLSEAELQKGVEALGARFSKADPQSLQKIREALLSPDPKQRAYLSDQLAQAARKAQGQAQQQQILFAVLLAVAVALLGLIFFSAVPASSYAPLVPPVAALGEGANAILWIGVILASGGAVYFWTQSQKAQTNARQSQEMAAAVKETLTTQNRTQQAARSALTAGALTQEASRKQTQDLKLPPGAQLLAADGSRAIPQDLITNRLYGLVGRPDKLIKYGDYLIPVEEKPKAPRVYNSHRIQAQAYCLLVELERGVTPPYALVITRDGATEIPWNTSARLQVLRAISRARDILALQTPPVATASAAQCKVCGVRKDCPTPVEA